MSHEILQHDRLILHKTAAWHGLGMVVQESLSPIEAAEIAGIDWGVESLPIFVQDTTDWGGETMTKVENARAIRRADTKEVFQVATDTYTPYQNRDLANLAMAIGNESGAKVESAGSLRNGRDVFFLLQTGSFVLPGVEDENRCYALLRNSHDGSSALQVFPTAIRVRCKNTWRMASRDASKGFAFRHTTTIHGRVAQGVKAIQKAREIAKVTEQAAIRLVSIPVSHSVAASYFEAAMVEALGFPDSERGKTIRKNQLGDIWASYCHPSNDGIRGTMWGAFNGLSHYTDHVHKARGLGNGQFSKLFGTGAEIKREGLKLALA